MSLESILYLLFGFLIAVFLTLTLVPIVWNRAVYLTEKKVKSSLPYNSREIEADKDALRAEHAMTVRRLELAIADLRGKASAHITELHGKRDENNRLKSSNTVAKEDLTNLENASEKMRGKIADMHERNTSLSDELQSITEKHEVLKMQHEELQTRHSQDAEELSRSRVDLVAKDGRIESLSATLETFNLPDDGKAGKVKSLADQLAAAKTQLAEERKLSKQLQKSAQALEKQLNTASNEIEASDKESSEELANTRKELETRILDLGEELMQEKTRSIELEAELARRALTADIAIDEEVGSDADENGSLEALKDDGDALRSDIEKMSDKKLTAAQKETLRAGLRDIGEKTASIAPTQS